MPPRGSLLQQWPLHSPVMGDVLLANELQGFNGEGGLLLGGNHKRHVSVYARRHSADIGLHTKERQKKDK